MSKFLIKLFILVHFFTTTVNAQDILQEAQDYYLSYSQQQSLALVGREVAENSESVEILLKSAKLKLLYGLDREANDDLNKAESLNPYAIFLFGFYGPEDILQVLSNTPTEDLVEISLDKRISYYLEMVKDKELSNHLHVEKSTSLVEVLNNLVDEELETALMKINSLSVDYPHSAIIYDIKGLIYESMDKKDLAQLNFKEAVTLEPGYAFAWYNLGRIEASKGEFVEAKKHYDRAINLKYDLTKAYFDRALVLKKLGYKESALEDYDHILQISNGDYLEANINRGLTKKILRDYRGALIDLNESIKISPDNPSLYFNRANLHLVFGYFADAISDFTKAIALNGNYAEAYLNRGLTYYLLGQQDKACMDINESTNLGLKNAVEKWKVFCN